MAPGCALKCSPGAHQAQEDVLLKFLAQRYAYLVWSLFFYLRGHDKIKPTAVRCVLLNIGFFQFNAVKYYQKGVSCILNRISPKLEYNLRVEVFCFS